MQQIAIIGSGLSGSILAILLARQGYQIDIIERATEDEIVNDTSDRSYNLTFYNYAIEILKKNKIWDYVAPAMSIVEGSVNYIEQRTIFTKSKVECWSFKRTGLLKGLVKVIKAERLANYEFGKNLIDIKRKEGEIILQDTQSRKYETRKYDAVIGADGVNSKLRALIQQGQESQHIQEYADWSYKQIDLDTKAVERLSLDMKHVYTWTNNNMILAALPNIGKTFSAVLMLRKNGPNSFANLNSEAKMDRFIKDNYPQLATAVPDLANQAARHREGYMVTVKTSPWHYQGNALIIGDAAHGFLPFSGQGVSAALADAVILADLAKKYKGEWETIFPEFEALRKIDADEVAELSKRSLDKYARTAKISPQIVYEAWEELMHKLMPQSFQAPMHVLLDQDPTKAATYIEKQNKQKELFSWLGGWIWAKILAEAYSYFNASMGWRLAARRAGYQPNRIPMPAETAKARAIDHKEIKKAADWSRA